MSSKIAWSSLVWWICYKEYFCAWPLASTVLKPDTIEVLWLYRLQEDLMGNYKFYQKIYTIVTKLAFLPRKNITLFCTMSAACEYFPPMFILSRKRMIQTLKKDGPTAPIMNEERFLESLKHLYTKLSAEEQILFEWIIMWVTFIWPSINISTTPYI